MAEYPTRQFSATNAYNAYMQALEDEEEKKKAYNMVHHMYKLTNPHYAGSSAESSNLSKISKLGSGTSSGLATRLRLMTAADKENLGMEFTGAFQQALESDLFTSLASFNTWANKQGPWYDEDLRRKHATTVKDMLDAQKSHKVSEAVSELYAKYAPAWGSRLVADQDRVIGEIEDDEVISSLPKKYRAEAIKQIHSLLQGGIPATGQYAAAAEGRAVAGAEREERAGRRLQEADWDTMTEQNFLRQAIDEIEGTVGGVPFADREPRAVEDVRREYGALLARAGVDSTNFMQSLDEAYGTRAQEIAREKAPGTKPVYDRSTDTTIYATDAEIESNDSLVPPAGESNLDPDTARIGALMAVKGEMPNEVWKKYYKGGMDLLYNSLVGPDAEHIKKWLLLVEEYKAKAAAGVGINLQLLQGGGATGQKDSGIIGVVPTPTNQ